MKKNKIYTKTGDKGTTSLVGGIRVPKNHIRLDAYGTIDELNSFLGLLRSQDINIEDKANILKIQNELFLIGASLATEDETKSKTSISLENINWLETEIDLIDQDLPPLNNFIIPSAYQPSAISNICRTVCRRAERHIITLSEHYFVANNILIYINRLSDYLFVLSRKISVNTNHNEDFFINNNWK